MPKFEKGHKKLGGRTEGGQNKITKTQTAEVAAFLAKYKSGEMADAEGKQVSMEADFCLMKPADRVLAAIRLQALITPKPIEVDLGAETKITIEDRLAVLALENEN